MEEYIKNRKGLKVLVVVEGDLKSGKLVFITHGLSSAHDAPHITGMREAFATAGFTVVSFDTTYSFGRSEGDSVNATASSYIADLEDVIAWVAQQDWYKEPFVLAGHSLGGISSLVYASRYPEKVSAIFPMSTVVSGKLWHETKEMRDSEHLKQWRQKGYYFKESKSMPGRSGKIGWGLAEDLLNYDVLEFAPNIKCPVLLLVGSDDDGTTPKMHQSLHDKLGGPKELHIIDGMEHTPRNQKEIDEMKNILEEWLRQF